jgi:hypothetical protein
MKEDRKNRMKEEFISSLNFVQYISRIAQFENR